MISPSLPISHDTIPMASDIDRSEVDAIVFVFRQSTGAVLSQKAQRRVARQKKVEVVWTGPTVVHWQRAVSRFFLLGTVVQRCEGLFLKIVVQT